MKNTTDITGIMQARIAYLLDAPGALAVLAEDTGDTTADTTAGLRRLLTDGTTFAVVVSILNGAVTVSVEAEIEGPGRGWYRSCGGMSVCGEGSGIRGRIADVLMAEAMDSYGFAVQRGERRKRANVAR